MSQISGRSNCDNKVCSFAEGITPEYSWGQSIVKAGDACLFREKEIIAEDKNSFLFGTDCRGIDLHCQVGDSMVIWENSIVHNCPFRRIMKQVEFEVTDTGFNSQSKNLNFIFSNSLNWCIESSLQ